MSRHRCKCSGYRWNMNGMKLRKKVQEVSCRHLSQPNDGQCETQVADPTQNQKLPTVLVGVDKAVTTFNAASVFFRLLEVCTPRDK